MQVNCAAYIFGELSSGYTQYPEDGSSELLKSLAANSKAPSQVIVHRDGSLMYYIYIRRFAPQQYIGFAIVINGYYIFNLNGLFERCEKELERLAEEGVIIHYASTGGLTTALDSLLIEKEEADASTSRILNWVSHLKDIHTLPSIDYSASQTSFKIFKITDNPQEIADTSYRLAYIYVFKEKDYDTLRMNSVSGLFSRLNVEKNNLLEENEKLKKANQKILRQKKQFKGIIWLLIGLFICGTGILILYKELNQTTTHLNDAQFTINEQSIEIQHLKHQLSSKRDSLRLALSDLNRERTARQSLSLELDRIMAYAPFVARDCRIINDELVCDYYSSSSRDIIVSIDIIDLSTRKVWSSAYNLSLLAGDDCFRLELPSKLRLDRRYLVLLKYDNKILLGMELW